VSDKLFGFQAGGASATVWPGYAAVTVHTRGYVLERVKLFQHLGPYVRVDLFSPTDKGTLVLILPAHQARKIARNILALGEEPGVVVHHSGTNEANAESPATEAPE